MGLNDKMITLKKRYLREMGIYAIDAKVGIEKLPTYSNHGAHTLDSKHPLQMNDLNGRHFISLLIITEGITPTEVIGHDVLSCFSGLQSGLKILVAVCSVEQRKIFEATRKLFNNKPMWFTVDPPSDLNSQIQACGCLPNEKYKKRLCIYEYRPELHSLMNSVDLSEIESSVSVNCTKKLNSVYIPEDFLKFALATKKGISISILNERFKWIG